MKTVSYEQSGVQVHEHRLQVPLDPQNVGASGIGPGEEVEVFARQLVREGGEELPHLLFLQGGPGGAGPRVGDLNEGWIGAALENYRVVLLDQRGTGASTPIDPEAVAGRPDPAEYLSLFLQPQILADAEAFRAELADGQPWTTLGQSYGGFLTLSYLSLYPGAVRESFITGGLPGLGGLDDIYRQTYPLTALRNQEFFAQYPGDEETFRQVAAHVGDTPEYLPTGERLTPTRLRSLGMALGGAMSYDQFHYLWEAPFVSRGGSKRLSPQFLAQVGEKVSQGNAPLYWVLQEAIYGAANFEATGKPTNWTAARLASEFPGFVPDSDPLDRSEPYYFTAEHAFPALIQEDPATSALFPAVEKLAQKTDWLPTYDLPLLDKGETPVSALIYYDDIYVPRELSKDTARLVGARVWMTKRMHHDGLRANGKEVFTNLMDLAGRDM